MSDAVVCQWDGEHFAPIGRYRTKCDQEYVVGQVYTLEAILERSTNTHRHFFAMVNDLWMNLPQGLDARFKSADHLRKHALIKAGYYDERSIVCSSPDEAARVAAFIQGIDDYAIVIVSDYVVRHLSAKSQSYKHMDAKTFQQSKQAVLDIIADMLGVTRKDAERAIA